MYMSICGHISRLAIQGRRKSNLIPVMTEVKAVWVDVGLTNQSAAIRIDSEKEMASKETRILYDPATGKKIPPPVRPKPVKMTATKLTRSSALNPPSKTAGSSPSTEDELDALTDLLVKNLENSSDPDFFGKSSFVFVFSLYFS